MTAVAFDIETTGLTADDEVISFALIYEDPRFEKILSLSEKVDSFSLEPKPQGACRVYSQDRNFPERWVLHKIIRFIKIQNADSVLVTFNGEGFTGGFDFPFLRTRFIRHGIEWPFKGRKHVDIFPIIQKRFNTSVVGYPTVDKLTKDDLTAVAKQLIGPVNPKATMAVIRDALASVDPVKVAECILATCEPQKRDINNLKGAYEILTGKDSGEMNGAEVVKLWSQYKETGDTSIIEQIREYNLADCRKTLELYNLIERYCGSRDLQPGVL